MDLASLLLSDQCVLNGAVVVGPEGTPVTGPSAPAVAGSWLRQPTRCTLGSGCERPRAGPGSRRVVDRGRVGVGFGTVPRVRPPTHRGAGRGHHRRPLRRDQRLGTGRTHRGVHHRGDHRRGASGDRRPTDGPRAPGPLDQRSATAAARGDRRPPPVGRIPAPPPGDAFAARGTRPRPRQGLRQHLRDREAGRRRVLDRRRARATGPGHAGRGRRRERSAVRGHDPRAGRGPPARGPG